VLLRSIATYLATGLSFAALDFVWLTQVGPKIYRPTLDSVLADQPNLSAAIVFYLVYILGVVALAVWPTRDQPLVRTALTGGLLGAMAYATYDLTNQATLKVWATSITLTDIAWGAFVTAVGATAGGWALRQLTRV
jgi:uncharacterized membrane protein